MSDKAEAGTLDAIRERRKYRFAEICAAIGLPVLSFTLLVILVSGTMAGTLEVPLKHYHPIVHWADNPIGFILVACGYLIGSTLFGWLSFVIWQARRGRY